MSRYCIEFSYNGEKYFGYQIQPKQISVQETLEQALSTILREEIKTTGAGRTDTGVHAKKMFAHFDTDLILEEELLPKRLNSFLPPDISVKRLFRVSSDFHARFDATYRTYEYYISLEKSVYAKFGVGLLEASAKLRSDERGLQNPFEYTDFTSFSKLNTDTKTNLCEIYKAFWVQEGAELKFTISANRFLRNMVRAIVGTMVDIGSGKIAPQDLRKVIEAKERNAAGLRLLHKGYFW